MKPLGPSPNQIKANRKLKKLERKARKNDRRKSALPPASRQGKVKK